MIIILSEKSVFQTLYDINVNEKVKQKNGLNYLSWADSLAEIKKIYPDAQFKIYEQILEVKEGIVTNSRFWFDDGKSGWVKVSVTIDGNEIIEQYPIMNFKNQAIPAENITSTDANKAVQRGLTKAAARHGLGLYIYSGEDIPEEEKKEAKRKAEKAKTELEEINENSFALAKILSKSKTFGKDIPALCRKYHASGNPRKIADIETAKKMLKELETMFDKLPEEEKPKEKEETDE